MGAVTFGAACRARIVIRPAGGHIGPMCAAHAVMLRSLSGDGRRWCLPLQAGKSRKIAVEGDPLATPFDGERCVPGIGDAPRTRVSADAELLEDVPVPFAGLHDLAVRLPAQILAKAKYLFERARGAEGAWVRGNPHYGA